jgi:hypothetical protein
MDNSQVYRKLNRIPLLSHTVWKNNEDGLEGFVAEVDKSNVEINNPSVDFEDLKSSLEREFSDSTVSFNSSDETYEVIF